ncbi:MAG: hypothetical protein QM756_33350 [Polyangiaceae bacterium]
MKSRWCLIFVGFLLSCHSERAELRKAVDGTAASIEAEMVGVRKALGALSAEIRDTYDKEATLDLTTSKLDAADGGPFKSFEDGKFYVKSERKGASFYVSPWKPDDEPLKRTLRFLLYTEPALVRASTSSELLRMTFYGVHEPQSIAMLCPWFDTVSNFPPGLDLRNFEWYRRGLESSGRALWSAAPFTDLANGWVVDLAEPVISHGAHRGVGVISVSMAKLNQKYLSQEKANLLLLGSDLTLLGQTPSARATSGLHELELVTLLQQTKENTFVPGRFKLDDATQPADAKELARRVKSGASDFELGLGGQQRRFAVARVGETGFFVIGFRNR